MNSKVFTLLLVIFGLLVAAMISRNGNVALLALPFVAYLGIGILQAPSAEKIRLHAERAIYNHELDGENVVEVSLAVTNQGKGLSRLTLSDALHPGMKVTSGQIQKMAALSSGAAIDLKYTFQTRRGKFSWDTVHAVISDPFGLVEIEFDLPARGEILVQPRLERFRILPLWPRRTLHSAGSIPARLGGSGTDFWGVREYHPGDPLRRLDWRRSARHPHQFFTKEFEQEEIADVGLILDARCKTDMRAGEDSLFEHAVQATASLAEVFLRQGNRVSVLINGERQVMLFPGYGKVQLNRILRALAQTTPALDSSMDSLNLVPVKLFSSHSLLIVISSLAPNDWMLFPR
ncbi:MAG TPA: DUF58 domain-containing protein, partial [Anaerolineales bacterium]